MRRTHSGLCDAFGIRLRRVFALAAQGKKETFAPGECKTLKPSDGDKQHGYFLL